MLVQSTLEISHGFLSLIQLLFDVLVYLFQGTYLIFKRPNFAICFPIVLGHLHYKMHMRSGGTVVILQAHRDQFSCLHIKAK